MKMDIYKKKRLPLSLAQCEFLSLKKYKPIYKCENVKLIDSYIASKSKKPWTACSQAAHSFLLLTYNFKILNLNTLSSKRFARSWGTENFSH